MATDKWVDLSDPDVSSFTGPMMEIADVVGSVAELLEKVSTLLLVIAELLDFPDSLLKAIVNAIINALQEFIEALLHYNVAMCINMNIKMDKSWTMKPTRVIDTDTETCELIYNPHLLPDEVLGAPGGDLPFSATGLTGWLVSLCQSAYSPHQPYRPVTDADTKVGGVMAVWGAPSFSDIGEFWPLFKEIFFSFEVDTKDTWWDPEYLSKLEKSNEDAQDAFEKAIAPDRIGSAHGSKIFQDEMTAKEEIAAAYNHLDTFLEGRIGSGVNPLDDMRGDDGKITIAGAFNSMPVWRSVPLAEIFGDGVRNFFDALRELLDKLKFPTNSGLVRLIRMLAKKAQQLSDLLERLEKLIDTIALLIDMVPQLHWLYMGRPDVDPRIEAPGGFAGFIGRALAAEDSPEEGDPDDPENLPWPSDAIVIGMCAVYTTEDLALPFERMMKLIAGDITALTDYVTEGTEKIAEAWEDVEDAAGDVVAEVMNEPRAEIDLGDSTGGDSGVRVLLDASGSEDLDGGELSFQWAVMKAPAASMHEFGSAYATIENPQEDLAYITLDAHGTYEVGVTVTIVETGKYATAYAELICV